MSDASVDDARRIEVLFQMRLGPIWLRRDASGLEERSEASLAEIPPRDGVTITAVAENAESPTSTTALPTRSLELSTTDDIIMAGPSALSAWDTAPAPATKASALSDAEIANLDWAGLRDAVATCTRCPLCKTRHRTVFGNGDQRARWLLVGEGPGRSEDQQGDPFVGPAGKLLDSMLQAIDLKRGENSYIANIVKCRATDSSGNDRAPSADEAAACRPYLDRQISLLQPATILALGKVAAISLLSSDPKTSVAALRGFVHQLGNAALVVTYHPAYLLRKPLDKAKSWQDLCLLRQTAATALLQSR